jgi:hypothetical protein
MLHSRLAVATLIAGQMDGQALGFTIPPTKGTAVRVRLACAYCSQSATHRPSFPTTNNHTELETSKIPSFPVSLRLTPARGRRQVTEAQVPARVQQEPKQQV